MTRSAATMRDPVLNVFQRLAEKEYGPNLTSAVLFGPRARGDFSNNPAYDVAVFFKHLLDKREELDRLDNLRTKMLETFDAVFNFLAFSSAEYEETSGLMKAIKTEGIHIMHAQNTTPDKPGINEKVEEILSVGDIFCLDIEASSLDEKSYPIEIGIANMKTGKSQSWLIRPTELWLNEYIWAVDSALIHNIPRQKLMDEGLPPEQVYKEMKKALMRARILSDDEECDGAWLQTLCEGAALGMSPLLIRDFHEFAWQLACASSRTPETALNVEKQKNGRKCSLTKQLSDQINCWNERRNKIALT